MPTARRKNARRNKHGRQHRIPFEPFKPTGSVQEVSGVQRALDRARDARDRVLTPGQREQLAEEQKRFSRELEQLRARTTERRRKLDEDYGKEVVKLSRTH